jgi:hypothetical protein
MTFTANFLNNSFLGCFPFENNAPRVCINYVLKHVNGKKTIIIKFLLQNIPRTKLLNRGVETGTFSEIRVKR